MATTQIYLSKEQHTYFKELAKQKGLGLSALVRLALNNLDEKLSKEGVK